MNPWKGYAHILRNLGLSMILLPSPSFAFDMGRIRVESSKSFYLEAPEIAISQMLSRNEKDATESVNLGRGLVFMSEEEGREFLKDEFSLESGFSISKVDGDNFGGISGIPSAAYNKLSTEKKRLLAKTQLREVAFDALVTDGDSVENLSSQLPQNVRRVLNVMASESPDVEPQPISKLIPGFASSDILWPQCYGATLYFYGLTEKLKFFAPPSVLTGEQTASQAQIDFFKQNGFLSLSVRRRDELKWGDIVTGGNSHTFVYLIDDFVFEKPDGDPYTAPRIGKIPMEWWLNADENVSVLRKP